MIVRVKLFAAAKQAVELDEVVVDLGHDATVADMKNALAEQYPQLARWIPHAMFSVNSEYVTADQVIPPAAEVALIPPVSGG